MSASPAGWTCGRCSGGNELAALDCSTCGTRLGPGARVAVDGAELAGGDWTTLVLAPLWIFFSVAGADGRVDDDEVRALRRPRSWRDASDDALFLDVGRTVLADFWGVVDLYQGDGRPPRVGLADTATLLDKLFSAPRSAAYRHALMRLGITVARASSGQILNLGRRVHRDEHRALVAIGDRLGLSDEALRDLGLTPLAGERSAPE